MTSYANRITDLEKQIALLKQQELQEQENKKNNSIEYNLGRIQQILDWNDLRTFNDWPGGHVTGAREKFSSENIGTARYIMLFGNVRLTQEMDPNNEIKLKNNKTYQEYDLKNDIKKKEPAMLDILQSINTSLNILNQRVSKIEKLIDDLEDEDELEEEEELEEEDELEEEELEEEDELEEEEEELEEEDELEEEELEELEEAKRIQRNLDLRKKATLKYSKTDKGKKARKEAQKRYYQRLKEKKEKLRLKGLL